MDICVQTKDLDVKGWETSHYLENKWTNENCSADPTLSDFKHLRLEQKANKKQK